MENYKFHEKIIINAIERVIKYLKANRKAQESLIVIGASCFFMLAMLPEVDSSDPTKTILAAGFYLFPLGLVWKILIDAKDK